MLLVSRAPLNLHSLEFPLFLVKERSDFRSDDWKAHFDVLDYDLVQGFTEIWDTGSHRNA